MSAINLEHPPQYDGILDVPKEIRTPSIGHAFGQFHGATAGLPTRRENRAAT